MIFKIRLSYIVYELSSTFHQVYACPGQKVAFVSATGMHASLCNIG